MDLRFARKDIEKLYIDTCSVYEYQQQTDSSTHITRPNVEVLVHENVPCKLSYKTVAYANEGIANSLSQVIMLIINPEIDIKPGSKILVTRDGVTTAYKNSGLPARHINHQQITLEHMDERA